MEDREDDEDGGVEGDEVTSCLCGTGTWTFQGGYLDIRVSVVCGLMFNPFSALDWAFESYSNFGFKFESYSYFLLGHIKMDFCYNKISVPGWLELTQSGKLLLGKTAVIPRICPHFIF